MAQSKSNVLAITEIVQDKSVYPRHHYGWQTAYDYAMSMKAGAKFPAIVVAEYAGNKYLVDGKHRIEAYKINKEKFVQCKILKGLSKQQIYLEAIKRNIANGRPLSPYDKVKVIVDLRKMKITDAEISKVICIPITKIENFVVSRITNDITGEEIILKAPTSTLAGQTVPVGFEAIQRPFSANGQMAIIDQAIRLFELKAINLKSKALVNKLKVLRKLIEKAVLSKRK